MGLASYMFRANYNYDSKYYIGASWSARTAYPAFRQTLAGVHSGEDQPLGVSLAKNSGANQLLMIGLTTYVSVPATLQSETLT